MQSKIKKTIICKDITDFAIDRSRNLTYTPKKGDIAIFEVIAIGKHHTLQSDSKRIMTIVEGDIIMAAFANRYATEQFEGYVPSEPTQLLDILGAGGAIGVLKSKHANFKHIPATQVKLVGYAVDQDGAIINSIYYKTPKVSFNQTVPNEAKVILSIGSSMDSGKTTTAAFLARGLSESGKKVAFIKLTGTCYTKDMDLVYDCGAQAAVDFTSAGFPSTYMCEKEELLDLYQTLLQLLASSKPDFIVMEIADGLLQRETEFLLRDQSFMNTISEVILSCGDSLAVFYGIEFLKNLGIQPAALSGVFTMSPLLIQEVVERSSIPVMTIDELMTSKVLAYFDPTYAN
ncbi:MAG: hypothetical protein CFE24_11610 [Flavobacterium sp. BFFFF2]|nr:MAG: hypothetical protein CFE24_11610 [Flavobacterium sp. BFFFF2]